MDLNQLTEERPDHVASELIAAWNSHHVDNIANLYALDYEGINVAQGRAIIGRDGIARMAEYYLLAFPDLHFTIVDTIQQECRVSVHWIATGTHLGRLMNIPPTGRSISVRGVSLLSIVNGRIKSGQMIWDVAGLLRSIGLLPEL